MNTQKLYLETNDLEGSATVTEVFDFGERQCVRLDRTLFHPQGGGQKADQGEIGGIPVLDVRHSHEGAIDHFVTGAPFTVGDIVKVVIDPVWRKEASRWHSAGHLIADCVVALDRRLSPLRGHHWPNEGRVEFSGDAIGLGSLVERLAHLLNEAVNDGVQFRVVGNPCCSRAVQIGNHDPVPCGGTHVASASALHGLKIRKVQQRPGVLRISYEFSET